MVSIFELMASIGLDLSEFKSSLSEAEKNLSKFGSGVSGAFSTAAKVGTAAVGAAATAVGALTKQAVDGYSQFEQLEGGIVTLFGEEASQTIIKNAENAFSAAGMAANDYLETATSFAASLIQATGRGEQQDLEELKKSLDDEVLATKRSLQDQYDARKDYWDELIRLEEDSGLKAQLREAKENELKALKRSNEDEIAALKEHNKELLAQAEAANNSSIKTQESLAEAASLVDLAVIDMSDNANKMGTNIASIQNAYQGFAKQNFTMLDNLKLGYGGTKEEMERLLADAERISGLEFDVSSYADIVQAIHLIQGELGIAGATADEAAGTMEGSAKALGAAWKNLIDNLANPDADLGALIDNVVRSAKAALKNFMPTIKQALTGISTLIKDVAPIIAEELPGLIEEILPDLLDAAGALIVGIVENLPQIIGTLIDAIPGVMSEIGGAILDVLPETLYSLLGIFDSTAGDIIGIVGGAVLVIKGMEIADNIGKIATAGLNLANQVMPGLSTGLSQLSAGFSQLATGGTGLTGVLANLGTVAWGLTDALLVMYDVQKLHEAASTYNEAAEAHQSETESALENYRQLYETKGKEVADQWAAMVYQIDTTSLNLEEAQGEIAKTIEGYWDGVPQNMWEGFKQGWDNYFGEGGEGVFSLLGDAFTGAVDGVMGILGIHSPSTVFYDMAGNTVQGYHDGLVDGAGKIDSGFDVVKSRITAFMESTGNMVESMKNIGINLISAIGNGFVSGASSVFNKIREVGVSIIQTAKNVFGIASPSKVFTGIGQFLDEGLAQGVIGNMDVVERAMDKMNGVVSGGGMEIENSFAPGIAQQSGDTNSRIEQLLITAIDTMKSARPINIDGKYMVAVLAPYIDAKLGEMMNYRQREAAWL